MKKLPFLMLLLISSVFTFAQSLNDVNELLGKNKNKEAKIAIDKFLADPKNAANSDAWFMKGRIYNNLSKDSSLAPTDALALKQTAFEAYKKNQQLDAKDIRMKLDGYNSYIDLYSGYFDIGGKGFTAKDYNSAYGAFKGALDIEDYVKAKGYDFNGFKFPAFDTSLNMNIALSARQAKNTDQAIIYYRKLADIGINGEQNMDIYNYLIDEYTKANNTTDLQAIINKAQQVYPSINWQQEIINNDLDKIVKLTDKTAAFAQYDELLKKYPTNYTINYYYSSELYNSLYTGETKPKDPEKTKALLQQTLKTAIDNNKEKNVDAENLMTRFLYNDAFDYGDSVKKYNSPSPAAVKKKADFKALYNKRIDEAIPHGEIVAKYYAELPKLKTGDKANYKIVLDSLSQLYAAKGDKAKADEYAKKKESIQ